MENIFAVRTEADANRRALVRGLVSHCRHSYQFAVRKTIHYKIIAPDMILITRSQADARPATQIHVDALLHPLPNLKTKKLESLKHSIANSGAIERIIVCKETGQVVDGW